MGSERESESEPEGEARAQGARSDASSPALLIAVTLVPPSLQLPPQR